MSVIKKWENLQKSGAQPQTGGPGSPWPQRRIDYAIWGALQQMVRQSFVSVDEVKRTIVEAWQKLPQSFIVKSVGEWHRRLE